MLFYFEISNHGQELDTDGSIYGESRNFEIFYELKQIYEDRLRKIDEETGDAGSQVRIF